MDIYAHAHTYIQSWMAIKKRHYLFWSLLKSKKGISSHNLRVLYPHTALGVNATVADSAYMG